MQFRRTQYNQWQMNPLISYDPLIVNGSLKENPNNLGRPIG